jgi:transmembrane sensor
MATNGGESISPDVLREAAAWFASLADASVSEADEQRWRSWLAAHPDHGRAWRRVEEVMGQLTPIAHAGGPVRNALAEPRRGRRKFLGGALGILAVAGVGAAVLQLPWQQWRTDAGMRRADYHTAMGKVAMTTLPDGTRVWLGSRGVLDMDYTRALRRLHLYRGDLLVETAADRDGSARPFVVDTPHGRLRALGTRFAVRADPGESRVDVFEGAIELTPARSSAPAHVVHAGEQSTFNSDAMLTVGRASVLREAWSQGMLMADRMRLDELVAELARWHPTRIECDPAVAGLQVVGAYPLQDPDRILAALAGSLPIRVVRDEGRIRLLADTARAVASEPPRYDTPPRRIE